MFTMKIIEGPTLSSKSKRALFNESTKSLPNARDMKALQPILNHTPRNY